MLIRPFDGRQLKLMSEALVHTNWSGMAKPVDAEHEPPFPWLAMASICMGMLAHSVVFTSPLPYVAFMVVDFGMAGNIDEAGYSAGWITGAFMIGRTVAGIPWGIACDRWGRKPCLLLSMFNVAVIGVAFGFSTSFSMAVALRLSIGLGNGFMGVAKTCVSEIVTTKDHEMKAFGYLNSIWGLGLIVGPALGGLLSRISIQYPGSVSDDSIWAEYPYLLPCLVCSSFAVMAFVGVLLFLPETLGNNRTLLTNEQLQAKRDGEAAEGEREVEMTPVTNPMRIGGSRGSEVVKSSRGKWRLPGGGSRGGGGGSKNKKDDAGVAFHALPSEEDEEDELSEGDEGEAEECMMRSGETSAKTETEGQSGRSSGSLAGDEESQLIGSSLHSRQHRLMSDPVEMTVVNPLSTAEAGAEPTEAAAVEAVAARPKKPCSMQEILADKDIQIMFLIYMFFCFLVIFIDECMPLWALTSLEKGGLAWESAQVGAVLACVGGALVLYQFFFYQRIMKAWFRGGPTDTFARLSMIAGATVSLVPLGAYLGSLAEPHNTPEKSQHNYLCFAGVVLFLIAYRVAAGSGFTTLGIVVNNSVDQSMRGTINGLIMTAGSMGNAGGPIIGSICYAVSLTLPQLLGPVPLDGRLMFPVGGLMAVLVSLFARQYMVVTD